MFEIWSGHVLVLTTVGRAIAEVDGRQNDVQSTLCASSDTRTCLPTYLGT